MPAPRWAAHFNRRVTNRLLAPLAMRLPGWGIVVHTGRKTHRRYRTPVIVFPRGDGYLIALTFGPHADWVRNVLASGRCVLETQGHTLALASPRLFHDERRRGLPALFRLLLGLGHVSDFLELMPEREASGETRASPATAS